MALIDRLTAWQPRMLSVLRIVTGLLFMQHGAQKLLTFPVSEPRDPVELMSLMGLAGVLELFGGAAIVLGLFTRPVAFLLAGEMAVAYFRAHFPRSFWPILSGGEVPALYCFIYLYLMTAGGGAWSLDRLLGRERLGERRAAAGEPTAA